MIQRRTFITAAAGLASALTSAGSGTAAAAAPLTLAIPRTNGSIEPRRTVRAEKLGWSYEVDIALPASYHASQSARYPVLWVTDGPQVFNLAAGIANGLAVGGVAPELIVVAVGCPIEAGALEWGRRRNIEFVPPGGDIYWEGVQGDIFRRMLGSNRPPAGHADLFLDFLVDTLRPALAADYRMADDHGLYGHSGGGLFACYALFARPGGFGRYVIGSPSINAVDRACFKMEKAYAATHKDLPAKVFFGTGEKEVTDPSLAAWGIVSSVTQMAEILRLREYPSLQLTTRIFPGKDHMTVVPDILSEGVQAVWADRPRAAKSPG
ncbi:MAG: alpha/beta hydrolase [Phenylobacterium sp.]